MWLLVGELRRIIARPTGSEGSSHQLQILCEERTKNGETRESIFTVGTSKPESYRKYEKRSIMLEVSPFPRKDGSLGLMLTEGGHVAPAESLLLDTGA